MRFKVELYRQNFSVLILQRIFCVCQCLKACGCLVGDRVVHLVVIL
jgi:hypothetical protein